MVIYLDKFNRKKIIIKKQSFEEYVEVIREHYPQVASALEITKITFKMIDEDLSYGDFSNVYPSFHLILDERENFLSIMIDFSTDLAFFLKKRGETKLFFSGRVLDDFEYPSKLTFTNIEEWMHQIVYHNFLYEKSKRNQL